MSFTKKIKITNPNIIVLDKNNLLLHITRPDEDDLNYLFQGFKSSSFEYKEI
jgi:hypothetical protein